MKLALDEFWVKVAVTMVEMFAVIALFLIFIALVEYIKKSLKEHYNLDIDYLMNKLFMLIALAALFYYFWN